MRILSSTELRANLARVLDQVVEDHTPVIIHRSTGKPVVMVSLEDWQAMDETTYLTSNPANKAALDRAIASFQNSGPFVVKTMQELEAMERE
jgi:antitoxin YefM